MSELIALIFAAAWVITGAWTMIYRERWRTAVERVLVERTVVEELRAETHLLRDTIARYQLPQARIQTQLPDIEAELTAPPLPPAGEETLQDSITRGLQALAAAEGRALTSEQARAEAVRLLSL